LARHCPECGFVVTEGANYCQRCGAYVGVREDTRDDVTTATYMIDEQTGELKPVDVGDVAASSGALVIRSGGGRVGQSFPARGRAIDDRALARRRDLSRRRDGFARSRGTRTAFGGMVLR
jgi:hypothetical protein